MTPYLQQNQKDIPFPWLPYAVGALCILFTLLCWHLLPNDAHYDALILTLGILLSIFMGVAIRLLQLTRQHNKVLELVDRHFKQEMDERIHAEETKQQLEKALLQGQKLQAMGTLAGGIAHDFNNILYAVMGYVELAREDMNNDSIAHKNLGKVIEGCKRGQELIARILTFSRRQHHDFKPICLNETIEGVLGLLRPTVPASVTIQFESLSKRSVIIGNQTQLHQVMVNLINNAVDAMEGEGTVAIELNSMSATDPIFHHFPAIPAKAYCRLTLRDTGHGMDQSTLSRIFEPFFTTKEVGKGTGLGLSTVHTIVKEHEGEILVESQLGHGTTFTILLPEHTETTEHDHGKNTVS